MTSVRNSNTNTGAGSFSSSTGIGVSVQSGRSYAYHSPKKSSGSWTISWTAPTTNVGDITFYLAAVSANGIGGNSGDKTYTQTLNINALNLISYAVNTTPPTCVGDSNGTALVTTPSGGAGAPYLYAWSGGISSTSNIATSLTSGSYSVTVEDNAGNEEIKNFTIGAGTTILSGATSAASICGDSTGSIYLNPSAGSSPYSFEWGNGDTIDSLVNLSAGQYHFTITDANGCIKQDQKLVGVSGSNLQFDKTTLPDYCGQSNGMMAVSNITGNIGPLSYLWSNGGLTDSVFNVSGGVYFVTIQDSIGCQETFTDTVQSSISLSYVDFTSESDACQAGIGSLSLDSSSGEVGAFNFNWSNGSNGQIDSLGGLTAGVYTVTVTDSLGCSLIRSLTVLDNQSPEVELLATNLSCFEDSSGKVQSSIASGTPPFSYLWSNGRQTDSISGLESGTFIVTVTDSLNCMSIDTAILIEPSAIVVDSILSAASDALLCDGSLEVFAQGGTGILSYQWDDPAQSTITNPTNLCPGVYQVVIQDENECELVRQEEVGQLPTSILELQNELSLNQNGGIIEIHGLEGNGSICRLYDIQGRKILEENISAKIGVVSLEERHSGVYLIEIRNEKFREVFKVYHP
jgi:hypothetical protein